MKSIPPAVAGGPGRLHRGKSFLCINIGDRCCGGRPRSATCRRVATNLLTRTVDVAKPNEPAPPPAPVERALERPVPVNFVISIDGEEHPIQVNNPIVLKMGNRNRRIVLKSVP